MAQPRPQSSLLYKQRSWSTDTYREEAWLRRKGNNYNRRSRRSKSVTDDDLDELKGCIELGFGFEVDSPDLNRRLSDTLPALELYYAVNKQYNDSVCKTLSESDADASSLSPSSSSSIGSPQILDPGDNPNMVKARLRQWAQVVACSVRQSR